MEETNKELLDNLVERESAILKAVLAKFKKERISDLNEPETKGLLAMYDRVSRNYTSEKINSAKDARMGIIHEERKQKAEVKVPPTAEKELAPAAAQPAAALPAAREESDLPYECVVKTNGNGEEKKTLCCIQGERVLNPGKAIIGSLTPAKSFYGVYYKFSNDKSAILTKTKGGNWMLKQRKQDGKYEIVGHVSINFGTEK